MNKIHNMHILARIFALARIILRQTKMCGARGPMGRWSPRSGTPWVVPPWVTLWEPLGTAAKTKNEVAGGNLRNCVVMCFAGGQNRL